MAEEELVQVHIRDDFYRDGFNRALIILGILILALALVCSSIAYLAFSKPAPILFNTLPEFRTFADVPVREQYLSPSDLLQWSSDVIPKIFTVDFLHYDSQLTANQPYFTDNGWKIFQDQISNYLNPETIHSTKMFLNAAPTSAPYIINQGLINGKYAWWIQMSLNVSYSSYKKTYEVPLIVQALVIRIPTLENLYGIAIDNLIVTNG